ncbi:MAG: Lrp/AsnC family transcriptional regulator [Thaumarchaeota archaeon]|nr:Lrp/AsnC family transcriptional regulator [Nitrososphaerota archaeon]MBI3641444.1 Lrp/AsnC family transcriptional regulator [Nitrososphaerota archaeon]
MTTDQLDERILDELLKNARRSYNQLADQLGISTGTVLKRIKNMESEGIIQKYSAILDNKKRGYEITAIVEVTARKGRLTEMEKSIAKMPSICAVYDTTGSADTILIGKFKHTDELSRFIKQLLDMPSVERTSTHLVLNTIKEDFRLLGAR